jgi:purine-binding chemotaxis protein CheW
MSESQIVICELKDESYGLDISRVFEIIRLQPITAVPQAPQFVDGVINLRGRIIPIVDLAARFGLPRSVGTKSSRIVVASTGETRVGLVVDGVSEVLMIPDERIEAAPTAVATSTDTSLLRGIVNLDDRLVMLLELDAILGGTAHLALVQAA